MVSYEHSRLCFKAMLIEPLEMHEVFEVRTSEGIFQMTKKAFYDVFSNVVNSRSYKEDGIYHYRKVPEKAQPYRLKTDNIAVQVSAVNALASVGDARAAEVLAEAAADEAADPYVQESVTSALSRLQMVATYTRSDN